MKTARERRILVQSTAALQECVQHCAERSLIGLDTEFMRRKTYFPVPALVQISDGESDWLIDPLACEDMSPLAALLEQDSVLKLIHACNEDLMVLWLLCKALPTPLIDTQIAMSLAGMTVQCSYSRAIRDHLAVLIDDAATMSNWLKRPLDAEQLSYAADDVRWLLPLFDKVRSELQRLDRMDWAYEDSARRGESLQREINPGFGHLLRQVKGAGTVRGKKRVVLRALCEWREAGARHRNIPRKWILSDEMLLRLCKELPANRKQLAAVLSRRERSRDRYVQSLLDCLLKSIETMESTDSEEPPKPPKVDMDIVRKLREEVHEHAENTLGIRPQVLLTKDECIEIARHMQHGVDLPEHLQNGWRAQQFGQLQVLSSRR